MEVPTTQESTGVFGVNVEARALTNFSMVVDPYDASVLYIGGDRQPGLGHALGEPSLSENRIGATGLTGRLFRYTDLNHDDFDNDAINDADDGGEFMWVPITDSGKVDKEHPGTTIGSAPHSGSRSMVFQQRSWSQK